MPVEPTLTEFATQLNSRINDLNNHGRSLCFALRTKPETVSAFDLDLLRSDIRSVQAWFDGVERMLDEGAGK